MLGSLMVVLSLAMTPCARVSRSTVTRDKDSSYSKLLEFPSIWLLMLGCSALGMTIAVFAASMWARLHDVSLFKFLEPTALKYHIIRIIVANLLISSFLGNFNRCKNWTSVCFLQYCSGFDILCHDNGDQEETGMFF